MSKCAYGRQHQSQLRNHGAHTQYTHHGSGNQTGYRAQSHHDGRQEADPGDSLHQSRYVDAGKGLDHTGEEGHQHIDRRLNQIRQIAGNAVQYLDQELHNGVHNLRRVGHQSIQHAGNQFQRTVGNGGHTFHKNIHQCQHQCLYCLANGGSAIGDDLTERHNSLAELLSNRRNQRCNARNDGSESGHNDSHACAQRSRQSRDTDGDSRKPRSDSK